MATVGKKVAARGKRVTGTPTKSITEDETMAQLMGKIAAKAKRTAIEAYDKVETKVKKMKRRRMTKARVERVKTVGKKVAKAAVVAGAVAAAAATIREIRSGKR